MLEAHKAEVVLRRLVRKIRADVVPPLQPPPSEDDVDLFSPLHRVTLGYVLKAVVGEVPGSWADGLTIHEWYGRAHDVPRSFCPEDMCGGVNNTATLGSNTAARAVTCERTEDADLCVYEESFNH